MGRKVVTEAQAWAILAKYYAKYPQKQYICFLLEDIDWGNLKDIDIEGVRDWPTQRMIHRIDYHQEGSVLYTLDDKDCRPFPRNDSRVIFCLLMALECKDEKFV